MLAVNLDRFPELIERLGSDVAVAGQLLDWEHAPAGDDSGITRVSLSPRVRLDDVIGRVREIPTGGTNCSLPITCETHFTLDGGGRTC